MQDWFYYGTLTIASLCAGGAITVTIRAVVKAFSPERRPIWFVEECQLGEYGEKPKVVWTSGLMPKKFAEILKNNLADDSRKLGSDNWFRVVREYEQ